MRHTVKEQGELGVVASRLIDAVILRGAPYVLLFTGDLGVGKTTLVQEIGKQLGVREHITSPTFVLMKSYAISLHKVLRTLSHIDLYRIEDEEEVSVLDLPALFSDTTRLTCIEWPERAPGKLPNQGLLVTLSIQGDGTRTITYDD
jgi:tRNA threonylcarbamoyladenosine biosynthesis protein TsaE